MIITPERKKHYDHTYVKILSEIMPSTSSNVGNILVSKLSPQPSTSRAVEQIIVPDLCIQSDMAQKNNNPNKEHDRYSRKRKHYDHTYVKNLSEVMPFTSCNVGNILSKLSPQPSTSCTVEQIIVPDLCIQSDMAQSKLTASNISTVSTTAQKSKEIATSNLQLDIMPPTSHNMRESLVANLSPQPSTSCSVETMPNCLLLALSAAFLVEYGAITKTPKKSTQRICLYQKIKSLTPNCQRIYREYCKSRRQLNFSRRAKRATKFDKDNSFERLTEEMNPIAKTLLWMQVKQCTKKSRGRRFTLEEKIIGLSIMKQSPKCYKFLQRIFILPSKTTLNKLISNLIIEPGISPQIFKAIKEEVNTWVANKKYCSIIFDEVALEAGLHYDKHKDAITGFVDLDHALVFMIRGALYKWQQPVAFYFCKGATKKAHLQRIIKDIVSAVADSGLMPLALVCDQGTAFCSAIKCLKEETLREQLQANNQIIDDIIIIKGHTLSVIYDPPHLLKGIRNNFLTKDIKFGQKICKWDDIVDVYKRDCNHAQMRLLPKLNDEHVLPDKIKKMKVKNCARVFSKTVAAALCYTTEFGHYTDGSIVSSTTQNTADIIDFFDDLFDSVNGAATFSKSSKGKPLRKAITPKSLHRQFWQEAIKKLKSITFINKANGKETTVPSLKNWITTIQIYQRVWQFFKSKNINIMRPRYFNSDPIEIFFGQVRAYNLRNNDPDCHTFKCTFESLLITRFIRFHSSSFNCEDDSGRQLLKIKSLFKIPQKHTNNDDESHHEYYVDFEPEMILHSVRQERLSVHSRAYTAGWVIRKILNKINCDICKDNLTSTAEEPSHTWITFREFQSIKKRKLSYPAEHALRFFSKIIEEANEYLEHLVDFNNINKNIKNTVTSRYTSDFLQCENHKKVVLDLFLEFSILLAVFNRCNIITRILKGTDVSRLDNKQMPPMQFKALKIYRSKLKNKRMNK